MIPVRHCCPGVEARGGDQGRASPSKREPWSAPQSRKNKTRVVTNALVQEQTVDTAWCTRSAQEETIDNKKK